jgi:hypothetical protein
MNAEVKKPKALIANRSGSNRADICGSPVYKPDRMGLKQRNTPAFEKQLTLKLNKSKRSLIVDESA